MASIRTEESEVTGSPARPNPESPRSACPASTPTRSSSPPSTTAPDVGPDPREGSAPSPPSLPPSQRPSSLNVLGIILLETRTGLKQHLREDRRFHPILIGGILVTFLLAVSFFISYMENIGYFDSFYACFITYSTIGFGDIDIFVSPVRSDPPRPSSPFPPSFVAENLVPVQLVQPAHLRQPHPHHRLHDLVRLDLLHPRQVRREKVLTGEATQRKKKNQRVRLSARLQLGDPTTPSLIPLAAG